MKVSIIQNSTLGDQGLLGAYLTARHWTLQSLVTYREVIATPFEALETDLVVILGSPRGVYEVEEAWIQREHALVEHLLARDIPIFGICFGAQLLAKVLGASVRAMEHPYRDWLENDHAPSDTWRGPWLRWHGDRIYPSDNLDVIASHAGITQAFHHGRTLGVQFHPEVTIEILSGWIDALPEERRQHARDTALAYYKTNQDVITRRSFALFDAVMGQLGL